jgi:hypothetical protein
MEFIMRKLLQKHEYSSKDVSSHRTNENRNTETSICSECTQTEQCLGTSISMILLAL